MAVATGLAVVAFLAIASVAFVHVSVLEDTGPRHALAWAAAMVVALVVALPWPRIRIYAGLRRRTCGASHTKQWT